MHTIKTFLSQNRESFFSVFFSVESETDILQELKSKTENVANLWTICFFPHGVLTRRNQGGKRPAGPKVQFASEFSAGC